MDPDSISKAFDRLIKATGVRRITFHGLRHTHISHQLMDGVHVKIVSERAGHANISTTLSVYAAFIQICRPMLPQVSTNGYATNSLSKSVAIVDFDPDE
jgi:integrase